MSSLQPFCIIQHDIDEQSDHHPRRITPDLPVTPLMTTKTVNHPASTPFSRLSRLGIGLGFSKSPHQSSISTSPLLEKPKQKKDDEDWYIAYNGPYEVPKDTRKRDSWGDVVEEDEGRDAILDADLLRRYGGGLMRDARDSAGYSSGKSRGRAYSATSWTGSSSMTVEPQSRSMRRQQMNDATHMNTRRTNNSASTGYISMDMAGGVGESPMSRQRSPRRPATANSTGVNRTSLANLFFGGPSMAVPASQNKRVGRSPSRTNIAQAATAAESSRAQKRRSTSLDLPREKHKPKGILPPPPPKDEDFYESYPSPLTPESHHTFGPQPKNTNTHPQPSIRVSTDDRDALYTYTPANPHSHPYAYTFPLDVGETSTSVAPPLAALPMSRSNTAPHPHALHTPNESTSTNDINTRKPIPFSAAGPKTSFTKLTTLSRLRSSVSVPNLQSKHHQEKAAPSLPSGMDRWLSAETWCDALLFPRPRFKVKQYADSSGSLSTGSEKRSSRRWSGRIVSPPLTPVTRSADTDTQGSNHHGSEPAVQERREQVINADLIAAGNTSRLRRHLTKSRSVVNLRSTLADPVDPIPVAGPSEASSPVDPVSRTNSKGKGRLPKHRPRDLTFDDHPLRGEPSLDRCVLCLVNSFYLIFFLRRDRVLDEGDQLEEQRRQWQAKATGSFGNKVTRNRSKSLNHKDAWHRRDKNGGKTMGSIDFIAARTLLGNQGVAPTIVRIPPPRSQSSRTGTTTTLSKGGHSHTASHTRSGSPTQSNSQKSSQATHGHRQHGSWGESALKLGALCGLQGQLASPPLVDEKTGTASGITRERSDRFPAMREEGDFVVIDPKISDDRAGTGGGGASPTPSGSGVGLAFSTPPASDDHSRQTYESISMPDHPYAQVSPYHYTIESDLKSPMRRYAGPHPSSPKVVPTSLSVSGNDISIRHRLPPQATLQVLPHMAHPYAMCSQYSVQPKIELLSQDVATPRRGLRIQHAYSRMSTGNPETLGVGEALTSMNKDASRDSGLLDPTAQELSRSESLGSKEGSASERGNNSPNSFPRVRRKPVSYIGYEDASPDYQDPNASLKIPKIERDTSYSTIGDSSGSSPLNSPQPLGNVEDLEHFRDLFYKPEESPEPSSPITFPFPVGSTQSIRSGLSSLARKLTEEYEERLSLEHPSEAGDHRSQLHDGARTSRRRNIVDDPEFPFSDGSKLRTSSPLRMDMPLPLHMEQHQSGPEDDLPEDIDSSRASSISQRSDEDDTFGELPFQLFGLVKLIVCLFMIQVSLFGLVQSKPLLLHLPHCMITKLWVICPSQWTRLNNRDRQAQALRGFCLGAAFCYQPPMSCVQATRHLRRRARVCLVFRTSQSHLSIPLQTLIVTTA